MACGTRSENSSSRFGIRSAVRMVTPVRLLPGRARLAMRPAATGSSPNTETMGIVDVAVFAAKAQLSPPLVTIASTFRLTKSAANTDSRSI